MQGGADSYRLRATKVEDVEITLKEKQVSGPGSLAIQKNKLFHLIYTFNKRVT